ncbi:hypothetical protein DPEC_G00012050 [Dallia pectoralis]|uniref:Uncharacterized protein n=1 Tax=Dallia pectoralis TaxID=75939 RepID=A0ACC2HLV9_DALPE|nr:hypothetical protein DPEC_G00012050 [Dallia pectoralis]
MRRPVKDSAPLEESVRQLDGNDCTSCASIPPPPPLPGLLLHSCSLNSSSTVPPTTSSSSNQSLHFSFTPTSSTLTTSYDSCSSSSRHWLLCSGHYRQTGRMGSNGPFNWCLNPNHCKVLNQSIILPLKRIQSVRDTGSD